MPSLPSLPTTVDSRSSSCAIRWLRSTTSLKTSATRPSTPCHSAGKPHGCIAALQRRQRAQDDGDLVCGRGATFDDLHGLSSWWIEARLRELNALIRRPAMGVPPPFGRVTTLSRRAWRPAHSDGSRARQRSLAASQDCPIGRRHYDSRQRRDGYLHIRTKLASLSKSGIFSTCSTAQVAGESDAQFR